ncbi:TRAF-like family protein [Citrus sinensis]|uniref:TRAF-like family protein n=1 Tax=Citrus sinensis TaxID=2711 RepID=A0ACB8KA90_CITSI|nr:TRAF-like family protein [Citrus sinensis]
MVSIGKVKREFPPPAHFIMEIESYSQLFAKFDDRYQSGIFEAGDYKWRLVFYPNGDKKSNASGHISLYLAIDDANNHRDNNWSVYVNFKFFVQDQNENKYLPIEEAKGVVREFNRRKKEWGCDRLLSLEAFMEPSNGYLVNDCCAFGVEVFVIKSTGCGETLSMVSVEPAESTHPWEIRNFRNLAYAGSQYSESFTVKERKWRIKICPMGDGSEMGRSLALYLILDKEESPQPNRKVYAKFKLRVLDHRRINHSEKQLSHWFTTKNSKDSEWGSNEFVPLMDLYDPGCGYLNNDGTLIVHVEFAVVSEVN